MTYRRHVPNIPAPARKEIPAPEILIHPENAPEAGHWRDTRPQTQKPNMPVWAPQYNELYDSLRTTRAWRYLADAYARGTITPTAGASVNVPIALILPQQLRVSQWPDGVQAYLCIHSFGIAPQSAPATVGAIELLYIDASGYTAPLGDYPSQTGGNSGQDILIPNPITDPSGQAIGNLSIQLQPGAGSPVTYNWSIGYGFAYLTPRLVGYKPEHHERESIDHDAIHSYHLP